MALTPERVEQRLRERFPGVPFERQHGEAVRDHTLYVPAERLVEICTFLRDDPELALRDAVVDGGVDYLPREPRFEVVYSLLSIDARRALHAQGARARGAAARADRDRRVAHRQLARARDLRLLRHRVRRPSRPDAHPAARRLGGLAAAQGFAARLRGGGVHAQHAAAARVPAPDLTKLKPKKVRYRAQ